MVYRASGAKDFECQDFETTVLAREGLDTPTEIAFGANPHRSH